MYNHSTDSRTRRYPGFGDIGDQYRTIVLSLSLVSLQHRGCDGRTKGPGEDRLAVDSD